MHGRSPLTDEEQEEYNESIAKRNRKEPTCYVAAAEPGKGGMKIKTNTPLLTRVYYLLSNPIRYIIKGEIRY